MRGHKIVLELPGSGTRLKIWPILSMSSFGTTVWSDGMSDPLWEFTPSFGCHPVTREFFWTSQCRVVGTDVLDMRATQEQAVNYADVPRADILEVEDFDRVILAGVFPGAAEELYFRRRFWWRANDPQRIGAERVLAEDRFRENHERILELVPAESPDRPLMAVEMAREVGDFERASELLDALPPESSPSVAGLLRERVKDRTSRVCILSLS